MHIHFIALFLDLERCLQYVVLIKLTGNSFSLHGHFDGINSNSGTGNIFSIVLHVFLSFMFVILLQRFVIYLVKFIPRHSNFSSYCGD